MDYMIELERARSVIEQSMVDAKSLAEKLPDGLIKVEALTLVSKLIQASVILSIRRPAVPCRLDFVSLEDTNPNKSIPKLSGHLANMIEAGKGKNCALVVITASDEDYAHVSSNQIIDDAIRVYPGYAVELLNPIF